MYRPALQRNHIRHRTARAHRGVSRAFATVSVVLAISLAVAFGFNGLVAAYAGWITLGNLLGVWFLQSRVGISMRDFLGAIAGPFAVAILASIVAMPINLIAAPDDRAHAIAPFLVSSWCSAPSTSHWGGGWTTYPVSVAAPNRRPMHRRMDKSLTRPPPVPASDRLRSSAHVVIPASTAASRPGVQTRAISGRRRVGRDRIQ